MAVRLQLLGGIRAQEGGRDLTWVPGQPVRSALLLYLAVEAEATREQLVRILWPDEEIERARHSLSQTLYLLRRALGQGSIQQQGDVVRLESRPETDVANFETAVSAGELDRAASLYRGAFLKDVRLVESREFEEWVDRQRARLERLHRRLRREQVDQRVSAEDLPGAIEVARAWVAIEPFEDEAQHRLIELLSLAGRRQEALAQYDSYERLLRGEELEPLDETRALVAELRAGRATPGDRPALEALALPSRRATAGAPPTPPTGAVGTPSVWTRFFGELKRRRVVRVAAVYLAGAFVVIQAAPSLFQALLLPDWAFRLLVVVLILGFLIAVPLAWAFDVGPGGIQRTLPADPAPERPRGEASAHPASGADRVERRRLLTGRDALTGVFIGTGGLAIIVLLVAGVWAFRSRQPADRITSVAVLPFSNLSRDADNEYFSDGLTEELLDHLVKVPGLKVAARTSSFYFKGKNLPAKDIARRLEVQSVLEGSVQRAGGRIRLTVQLISARTGYHVWGESYDREAGDLFAVEDEISRAIVSALRIRLAGSAPIRSHVPDSAAHDLYLRGRFLLNRGTRADLERSIQLFQQAISRDPAYPEAYAAAATSWSYLADAYLPPLEAYPQTEALARRALALDEANAEAHADLAYSAMILRWDWASAEREFRRALELNPRDASSHSSYASYLTARGDLRGALTEFRQAVSLEPFFAYAAYELVVAWWLLGEPDSAIEAYDHQREIAPGYAYANTSVTLAYREKGRYREALALDQKFASDAGVPSHGLVEDLVALGRRTEAEAALDRMVAESRKRHVVPENVALAALALGHREQALQWLERGVQLHSANAVVIARFPQLRPLLSDPRYQRLLRRMGLQAAPR